jgi:hypothetical protein
MKLFMCFLLLFGGAAARSQSQVSDRTQDEKLRFTSINQVGFLAGASASELQLQSINGVRWKGLSAGAGAGLDYYYYRSVTAFVDVRKNLKYRSFPFFVYGAIGANIPWVYRADENPWFSSNYGNGWYGDAGLGHKIPLGKTTAILLNIGYSVKTFEEERTNRIPCTTGFCPGSKERLNYGLRRISVRTGVQF